MNDFLNFLVTGWYWILIAIVGLIILVKFIPRYKIAPPDTALIISGLIRRNYKVRNPDGTVSSKKFGYRIVRGGPAGYVPEPGGYQNGAAGSHQGIHLRAGGRGGQHQDRFG